MKKLLTFLVLVGLLLSLQVSFVSAQEPADTPEPTTYVVEERDTAETHRGGIWHLGRRLVGG
jgi:hypothetical protein